MKILKFQKEVLGQKNTCIREQKKRLADGQDHFDFKDFFGVDHF